MKINKEKVSFIAKNIMKNLLDNKFTAEETVALLKCLSHITGAQCLDKEMVVVNRKLLMEIVSGEKSIKAIEGI